MQSWVFAAVSLAAGCDPEIVITPHELVLRLPPEVGESCRPTSPTTGREVAATGLEIAATGDFPADESTVEAVAFGEAAPMPIDTFPPATRDLVLTLRSDGDADYVGAVRANMIGIIADKQRSKDDGWFSRFFR